MKDWWSEEVYRRGGAWIGALRSRIQWVCKNGERVTWGSNDVLEPSLTIGQVERLASEAVAADRNERASDAEHLLKYLVKAVETENRLETKIGLKRAKEFLYPEKRE